MNPEKAMLTPPVEEGKCGIWTYHEWAEADSTNDLARSFPHHHIAVCRVQHSGRGRFNRPWIGAEGGLWASFNLPLESPLAAPTPPNWGHLPLVAGLALLSMCRAFGLESARLRWPNDLLVGTRKLAGILVERPSANLAIIGIGINIFNDVVSIADQVATPPVRLADLLTDCPCIHDVMAELAKHLEQTFRKFAAGGLPALRTELEAAWQGTRPVCLETDEENIHGMFMGVDDEGNPVLSLSDGQTMTVSALRVNRLIES